MGWGTLAEGLSGHPPATGPNVAVWAEVLWSMLAFYLLSCFLFTKINKGEKNKNKKVLFFLNECRYCGVRW